MFRSTRLSLTRQIISQYRIPHYIGREIMTLAAAGQFCSTGSMAENLASVKSLIQQSVEAGAKVLFLPEASDYIARSPAETVALARPIEQSEFVIGIQEELRNLETSLEVSVGIHESVENEDRCKNVLLWINSRGEITQRYQKLHLFDVNLKNGPLLMESRSVQPGQDVLPPFDSPLGKIGYAICYDIRFPEHALRLRTLGADIITYPSAFTVRTGQAHWELLGRARAVDTQTYVIMAAQVGAHDREGMRRSWGHAMIIDPWGTILAQCPDTDSLPRICVADIDLEVVEKVRADMPLWQQRRGVDVYGYNV
ncbi:carbon-nitrogen hydrolase [Lipomyces tetrasporus]|uniref:Carbon-nitrogen hydrolase n=1 Tax=Lipomyces tetrasporus TaxID=54092 RepID=A0AAD7VRM3_9ASCO|nr:carbon-nitrogen hydrolase [Lipomyces tetrasporus]KAJ8098275.1 carbon-nitrogen hydrolase [Lipomyces tetrasporus]